MGTDEMVWPVLPKETSRFGARCWKVDDASLESCFRSLQGRVSKANSEMRVWISCQSGLIVASLNKSSETRKAPWETQRQPETDGGEAGSGRGGERRRVNDEGRTRRRLRTTVSAHQVILPSPFSVRLSHSFLFYFCSSPVSFFSSVISHPSLFLSSCFLFSFGPSSVFTAVFSGHCTCSLSISCLFLLVSHNVKSFMRVHVLSTLQRKFLHRTWTLVQQSWTEVFRAKMATRTWGNTADKIVKSWLD